MPDETEIIDPQSEQPKPKRDFRQEVTDSIVDMIEKGTAPWQKPGIQTRRSSYP